MPDPVTAAFRFGFGLPWSGGALPSAPSGPDLMARSYPVTSFATLLPLIRQAEAEARRFRREKDPAARQAYRGYLRQIDEVAMGAIRSAFARALDAPDGYRERLALFWADHFTVTARSRLHAPLPATLMDEAIRPHLTGRFEQMLMAVTLHPAMLIYLDQTQSFGPNSRVGQRRGKGLNENLARELLELHTLGAGASYGQRDVRELAELLTGLNVGKEGFAYDPRRAEPGAEQVLGQEYAGETLETIHALLADLARRPETARHIARKLAVHFVSDSPDPALTGALEAAWRDSGGDLAVVHAALLDHPAAWRSVAEKARTPFEFLVAALRGLGLDGAEVMALDRRQVQRHLLIPMAEMGQPWQSAPGPDGWPEAASRWISPQGLAGRLRWAMSAPAALRPALPDPAGLARDVLGGRASAALLWALPRAETLDEAVGLVFSAPEFNRR